MPGSSRSALPESPRRTVRVALAIIVSAVVALAGVLVVPLSAQAAPVALSAKVVGPTGSAMAGLGVSLLTHPSGPVVATATTNSSGSLTFASVTAGTYTLQFPRTSTTFAQYLGGAADREDAQFVILDVGSTATLSVSLAAAGTVSGAVKTTSGSAVSGATATLLREVDGAWESVRTATTSSTGAYSITGIEPGEYVVRVSKSGFATTFTGNATHLDSATPVGVFAQKTTKADFRIGTAARISGVVKGDLGGIVPLAGATVTAYRYVGIPGAFTGVEAVGSATAGSTGAYSIGGLPPGTYTVHFAPPAGDSLGAAFLGRAATFDTATKFELASGAHATGKSLTLLEAASISGLLREVGTLDPIGDARVTLTGDGDDPDAGEVLAVTTTDASGAFTFGNLAPGAYVVTFGSFADGDPDDGVTENTGFERRSYPGLELSSGQVLTGVNVTTEARVAVEPLSGSEPVIDGMPATVRVGDYLTSSFGLWASSGYSVSGGYTWLRDGDPIPGATEHNYQVRPGDLGHTLSLVVDRFDWALGEGSYETAATPEVQVATTPLGPDVAPTIQGTPAVGQTLTVDFGSWTAYGSLAGPEDLDPGILWTDVTWQTSADQNTWTTVATGSSHVVTHADQLAGPYLRVLLDGTRYGFPDIVDYEPLRKYLVDGTYTNVVPPSVSRSSTLLTAKPGTWSPTPETIDYEWEVFDPATSTSTTYSGPTLARSLAGTGYVTLSVTVSGGGMVPETVWVSAQTGPQHTASGAVTITGTARVGSELTAVSPTWTPTPGTTAYKWQYLSGTTWKTIASATASTYTIPASLKGKRMRAVLTVTSTGYLPTTKSSAATAAVATGLAPVPTVDPSGSGTAGINNTVTVNPGTWSPTATFGYSWRSRTTPGGTPTTISGATGSSYTIPGSLANKYLEVVVTAKRSGHANGTFVLSFGQVLGGTHKNTVKPTVSHDGAGNYTATSPGTWTPAPSSFQYTWFQTVQNGTQTVLCGDTVCTGTNDTALYRPIDLRVTASSGSYSTGEVWIPVKNGLFEFISPPSTSGSGQVGEVLTLASTSLSNPPDVYTIARQWQWKDGSTWRSISGATGSTYTPTATYLGKQVRARVTVSATRYTSLVGYADPVVVTLGDTLTPQSGLEPTVNGSPGVGIKLSATPGTWSVPSPTIAYRWQIADTMGGPFTDISGATASTYTPTTAQFGKFIRLRVTASAPGYGSGVHLSDTAEIVTRSLVVKTKPTVSRSGDVLTVSNGTWDVTPTEYTYIWKRWNLDGMGVTSIGSGPSYTLGANDAGHLITVEVIAARPTIYTGGSSEVVAVQGARIRPQSALAVTGVPRSGELLQINTPDWEPLFTSVSYQWYRNGTPVTGAVSALYAAGAADVGTSLSVKVTGVGFGHPSYSTTITVGQIGQAVLPAATVDPAITVPGGGDAQVGDVLTASSGTWSVSGLSYAYQWYRGGVRILGATASSYTAIAADLDQEVRVVVTASKKGYGPGTATSASRTVLLGDAITATPTLTISVTSGTAKSNALTWAKPVTVFYTWMTSTDGGSSWTTVSNASTFATAGLAAGTQLRLQVYATRPGHDDGSIESNVLTF